MPEILDPKTLYPASGSLPKLSDAPPYANAVTVGLSSVGDVVMTFSLNGNAIFTMNIPLMLAHEFAGALRSAVTDYEKYTSSKVPTPKDLQARMNAAIGIK